MKREIEKFERNVDSLMEVCFETIVLPGLKKAARKLNIDYITEMNNYYFFKIGDKDYIENDFFDLGAKYANFYKVYIEPIANSRYTYLFDNVSMH